MSTNRNFHIRSFKSQIVPDVYFAIVLDESKIRIVFVSVVCASRYAARHLARHWAETSQSKKAKSLEPKGLV